MNAERQLYEISRHGFCCPCGRLLRAVIYRRPGRGRLLRIFRREHRRNSHPIDRCPNCRRSFRGLTPAEFLAQLERNWS